MRTSSSSCGESGKRVTFPTRLIALTVWMTRSSCSTSSMHIGSLARARLCTRYILAITTSRADAVIRIAGSSSITRHRYGKRGANLPYTRRLWRVTARITRRCSAGGMRRIRNWSLGNRQCRGVQALHCTVADTARCNNMELLISHTFNYKKSRIRTAGRRAARSSAECGCENFIVIISILP